MPSIVLISRIPSAPSDAVPDSTTPIACAPSDARERPKEEIDRVVLASIFGAAAKVQMTVDELHLRVGRHDVHAVRLDARALGGFQHGERRMAGEQRGQRAGVVRREMLDENNREIGIARQPLEKLRKCLEPPGRGADADDGEVWVPVGWRRIGEGVGRPLGAKTYRTLRPACSARNMTRQPVHNRRHGSHGNLEGDESAMQSDSG